MVACDAADSRYVQVGIIGNLCGWSLEAPLELARAVTYACTQALFSRNLIGKLLQRLLPDGQCPGRLATAFELNAELVGCE